MMSTVTNTQVAVKYRQNVCGLSIDMLADNRTTTLGRHIDWHIGRVSVDISTDARPMCQPIYRATHLGRHIDRYLTNMSTDISVATRPICQPIRQSTVGRYVEGCTKYTWSQISRIFCKRSQNFILTVCHWSLLLCDFCFIDMFWLCYTSIGCNKLCLTGSCWFRPMSSSPPLSSPPHQLN